LLSFFFYRYVSDLVGKGGAVRKALQDHTGVRIIVPPNVPRDNKMGPVKITLAGPHPKVAEAKKLIHELMENYITSVTHPGLVSREMDVPSSLYNVIIGTKGAEIRHIENNFKVSVYIPNEYSINKRVVIVGEAKPVTSAAAYIQKIMDKATQDKEAAILASDAWAEHESDATEPVEEWMSQYLRTSNPPINLLSKLFIHNIFFLY
jgi:rRNA processing protein Krr1/Pno1